MLSLLSECKGQWWESKSIMHQCSCRIETEEMYPAARLWVSEVSWSKVEVEIEALQANRLLRK